MPIDDDKHRRGDTAAREGECGVLTSSHDEKVVGGLLVVGERSGSRRVEVVDGGTNGVRGRGRRRRGPMRLILTGRESPRTERNHQRGSGIALNPKREEKPKGRYSGGDWLILIGLDA